MTDCFPEFVRGTPTSSAPEQSGLRTNSQPSDETTTIDVTQNSNQATTVSRYLEPSRNRVKDIEDYNGLDALQSTLATPYFTEEVLSIREGEAAQ